ncbi:MAG TPA: TOBE domain-containing protein [Acidimicrobiia bacterium]|nr:TOBE domain-containing protein [Acidimicrobiia bacterium]
MTAGNAILRTTSEVEGVSGDDVVLMVRPEELEMGEHEENQISGVVESINFLGAIVRVRLETASGLLTADLFNERLLKLPDVGDTVTMSFPAHACWVMAGGTSDAPT